MVRDVQQALPMSESNARSVKTKSAMRARLEAAATVPGETRTLKGR